MTNNFFHCDRQLSLWLQTPAGRHSLAWLQNSLDRQTANIFGYGAGQFGLPEYDLLRSSRILHKYYLLPASHSQHSGRGKAVPCDSPYQIPLASESLDLVILPFALHLIEAPGSLLQEISRILVHDGKLFIAGFSRWSLWSMSCRGRRAQYLPGGRPRLALPRLCGMLSEHAFGIDRGEFGCYEPACASPEQFARWQFLNKAGDRWWPSAGSVYLIRASKQTCRLGLVGPALATGAKRRAGKPVAVSKTCSEPVKPEHVND